MGAVNNPRYRLVLSLRDDEKLTFAEIGERIGTRKERAASIYRTAKARANEPAHWTDIFPTRIANAIKAAGGDDEEYFKALILKGGAIPGIGWKALRDLHRHFWPDQYSDKSWPAVSEESGRDRVTDDRERMQMLVREAYEEGYWDGLDLEPHEDGDVAAGWAESDARKKLAGEMPLYRETDDYPDD